MDDYKSSRIIYNPLDSPRPTKSGRISIIIAIATSLLFLSILALSVYLSIQFSSSQQEVAALSDQMLQLQNENTAIKKELSAINFQTAQYRSLLSEARGIIDEANDEIFYYTNLVVYITSTGTKYHRRDCPHLGRMLPYIRLRSDAIFLGYTQCLDCSTIETNAVLSNNLNLLTRLREMENSALSGISSTPP